MIAFQLAVSFDPPISPLQYTRSTCTIATLFLTTIIHLFPEACLDFPGPAIRNSVLHIFKSPASVIISMILLKEKENGRVAMADDRSEMSHISIGGEMMKKIKEKTKEETAREE